MDRESAEAIAILGQLPLARELSSTHSTESTSIEMQIQAKLVRNLWLLYSYTQGSYVKKLRYCFAIKSRSLKSRSAQPTEHSIKIHLLKNNLNRKSFKKVIYNTFVLIRIPCLILIY